MTEGPASSAIARLSPTSYEVLRECPLRFSFAQAGHGRGFAGTPAARLGTVCHNVLDKAVRDGALSLEDWRFAVEQLWDAEVAAERNRAAAAGLRDAPERWPSYQLKRARLFKVAGLVRDFLRGLPSDAEVLTEQDLTANDGLLYGRADLVIRSEARHQIVDYKSGGILERESDLPRSVYVRQLQLYAYLEHASSGRWPSTAHLFPLTGKPVEIEIEADTCKELAAEALAALSAYNAQVPARQPARPAPDHCRWCPAAASCAAFWNACDETWTPAVRAVRGTVRTVFSTELGGITFYVSSANGSIPNEEVVVKGVDPTVHPDASAVTQGDEVAVTGLIPDDHGSGFRLGLGGAVSVARPVRG